MLLHNPNIVCSSQMERLDSPDDFDILMKYLFSLSAISMKREPGDKKR